MGNALDLGGCHRIDTVGEELLCVGWQLLHVNERGHRLEVVFYPVMHFPQQKAVLFERRGKFLPDHSEHSVRPPTGWIVFVTANEADLSERRDALVVAKPVHRSDLKRAVRQAMGQSG